MEQAELIGRNAELLEQKLRAQAELYRMLLGLARRQAEELSAEDVDAFVASLEDKKKVVGEIDDLEAAADPLRRFWEEHKDDVAEDTRAKLRAVVDEIRVLLEELLELEADSQRRLGVTKDSLEEQIRQLSVGPKAMLSYSRKTDHRPRFMDEMG